MAVLIASASKWQPGESWDNTEPLKLRPCPEIYEHLGCKHGGPMALITLGCAREEVHEPTFGQVEVRYW